MKYLRQCFAHSKCHENTSSSVSATFIVLWPEYNKYLTMTRAIYFQLSEEHCPAFFSEAPQKIIHCKVKADQREDA